MHRVLIIWLVVSLCGGMVVPVKEQKNEQIHREQQLNERGVATSSINNQEQSHYSPIAKGNQAVASRYFYPSYPEYTNGYVMQTGYENYLVPTSLQTQTANAFSAVDVVTSLLPFSSEILVYGARAGAYLVHFLFSILVGGLFMTLLCMYTSICTNYLGLSLTNDQVKEQIAEIARSYMTTEAVNAATVLVSQALEKYSAMQTDEYENVKLKETDKPV